MIILTGEELTDEGRARLRSYIEHPETIVDRDTVNQLMEATAVLLENHDNLEATKQNLESIRIRINQLAEEAKQWEL